MYAIGATFTPHVFKLTSFDWKLRNIPSVWLGFYLPLLFFFNPVKNRPVHTFAPSHKPLYHGQWKRPSGRTSIKRAMNQLVSPSGDRWPSVLASAPPLGARGAKACVLEPRDPEFNLQPCPFRSEWASYRLPIVFHYCVIHVKESRLWQWAVILHWQNVSSTPETPDARGGWLTSGCLDIHITLE